MTGRLTLTGSQTVGPFFNVGFSSSYVGDLAAADVPGLHLTLRGRVLDGDGQGVPDALIEIWQADANGCYPAGGSAFRGFGRVPTDAAGGFTFTTIKPGRVAGPDGTLQAPHLLLNIFMRGLLRHLTTRVYFPGEASNAEDPVLGLVEPARRRTLIAIEIPSEPAVFEWNIALQGRDETVFFDC